MERLMMTVVVAMMLTGAETARAIDFEEEARVSLANENTSPLPQAWALGLGVYMAGDVYRGESTEYMAVPVVYYRSEEAKILLKKATYNLWRTDHVELDVLADLRFDGYEEDDSVALKGMDRRHMTLDAGLEAEVDIGLGEIEITVVTDTLSRHEGQEAVMAYTLPLIIGRFYFKPSLFMNHKSSNLTRYYYGVKASEVTADRAVYTPDGSFGSGAAVMANWRFARDGMLMAYLHYERFGSEIRDSPIVDESASLSGLLGLVYLF